MKPQPPKVLLLHVPSAPEWLQFSVQLMEELYGGETEVVLVASVPPWHSSSPKLLGGTSKLLV